MHTVISNNNLDLFPFRQKETILRDKKFSENCESFGLNFMVRGIFSIPATHQLFSVNLAYMNSSIKNSIIKRRWNQTRLDILILYL